MRSSAADTSARVAVSSGGSSLRIAVVTSAGVSPLNARWPANIITNLVRWPNDSEMRVLAAAISADYVAAGYRDGVLVLWQRGTWQQVAWVKANQSFVADLAFSSDGSLLATAGAGHVLPVWEVK